MIQNKPKPPATKKSFSHGWLELDYLCKKIHYWLYARKQKANAERYLDRLERVLRDLPKNDMAIIREEGLALSCELKGDIDKSILHRKREIELMERLHKEAQSPKYAASTRAYMLRDCDTAALRARRTILESLKQASASRRRQSGRLVG